MRKFIRNFLNGMAFGITETVPGVSGGTIAVIMGFYDELVKAVNHFKKNKKESLKFLIPLFFGIIAGFVAFGSLVTYLLTVYSFPTMLFFMGLIAGIIPLIYLKLIKLRRGFTPKRFLLIALPALALAAVSGLKETSVINPAEVISAMGISSMFFVFFAGILAAAALVIPGVSGSAVLLMMGVYPLATYCLSKIGPLLADITNITLLLDICKVCVPLGTGVVIGALAMLRLIEKLLKNHYETVYSVILGLLAGSVYALINDPIVFKSYIESSEGVKWNILVFFGGKVQIPPLTLTIGLFTFALGAAISFLSGKNAFNIKKEKHG
ncbi:MAG: DUF368 domain-containing protein [Oscillospiraceae bacterium]|nr:DUF368 domain-containing protein [Oscillospiraceae bacterium]